MKAIFCYKIAGQVTSHGNYLQYKIMLHLSYIGSYIYIHISKQLDQYTHHRDKDTCRNKQMTAFLIDQNKYYPQRRK